MSLRAYALTINLPRNGITRLVVILVVLYAPTPTIRPSGTGSLKESCYNVVGMRVSNNQVH